MRGPLPLLVRLAPLLVCMAAIAHAARADQPLARLLRLLPPQVSQSGIVFSYLRQSPELAGDVAAHAVVTDIGNGIRDAMAAPDSAARLTGIDFGRIDGVLRYGDTADAGVLIAGPERFADRAPGVLVAGGFKPQDAAGRQVCVMNNPDDIDEEYTRPSPDDPFADGGSLYCLAAAGDLAIVARTKSLMTEALARRAGNPGCALCEAFGAMLSASRTARGGSGDVVSALGFSISAHAVGLDLTRFMAGMMDGTTSLDEVRAKVEAQLAKPRAPFPAHALSLLSAARSPEGETAQIALLYADRGQAEAAAPIVLGRLEALPRLSGEAGPASSGLAYVTDARGSTIAVLTLRFGRDARRAALHELAGWVAATFNRSFAVLDPLR